MPIQYGTVQCGGILGGVLFYQEYEFMAAWQFTLTFVGLATIVGGIALGAAPQPQLPHRAERGGT